MLSLRLRLRLRSPSAWIVGALTGAIVSCTHAEPRWVRLARHVDDPLDALAGSSDWGAARGLELSIEAPGDSPRAQPRVWVERAVPARRWQPIADGGWRALEPLHRAAGSQIGGGVRLHEGSRELRWYGPVVRGDKLRRLGPGTFRYDVDGLYLRRESAPPDLDYAVGIVADRFVGGATRVELERWSGEGWLVWSGTERLATCEIPADARLDFFVGASGFCPEDRGSTARLRVFAQDELLLDDTLELFEPGTRLRAHSLALPSQLRGSATLRFELDGPPAIAAVLAPTLRPAEVGGYGARPWSDARPDVVLFVADTFRADNMEVYGGEHELTSRLDALASEGLVFTRAWSPAPWTVPAQSAMLCGRTPPRIQPDERPLGASMVTVAEHLAAAGYRTGAVTDGVFVSRTSGFHQGFALFDEGRRSLEETQRAVDAFLDADDDRPAFLFVQSYRVHEPYRVSDGTRTEHGERLGIRGDFESASKLHRTADPDEPDDVLRKRAEAVRRLRALYRGGVIDLDRWSGAFVTSLEDRGLLRDGYLIFTSDHGEAFAEHGTLRHVGGLWEEHIRIPLFFYGDRIDAGSNAHASTLTDLAHSICDLADLPPRPEWDGTSLMELDRDRTLLAFERVVAAEGDLAVIRGPHKLLAPADADALRAGTPRAAFDLAQDPGETRDVRAREPWPAELARATAPEMRRLLAIQSARLAESSFAEPTAAVPERAERLEALGYAEAP